MRRHLRVVVEHAVEGPVEPVVHVVPQRAFLALAVRARPAVLLVAPRPQPVQRAEDGVVHLLVPASTRPPRLEVVGQKSDLRAGFM